MPLLLVLAYRPEHLHPWGGAESHTTITLDPLPRASAAALARGVLARPQAAQVSLAALPPPRRRRSRTAPPRTGPPAGPRAPRGPAGGRQSALRRGANARTARRRPRRYRPIRHRRPRHHCRRSTVGNGGARRQPPTSLRRARPPRLPRLAAQAPALSPTTPPRPGPRPARPAAHRAGRAAGAGRNRLAAPLRHTLQAAAAIGPTFSYPLLAAVGEPTLALDPTLLQLEDLGLVQLTRLAPERAYAFKHVSSRTSSTTPCRPRPARPTTTASAPRSKRSTPTAWRSTTS